MTALKRRLNEFQSKTSFINDGKFDIIVPENYHRISKSQIPFESFSRANRRIRLLFLIGSIPACSKPLLFVCETRRIRTFPRNQNRFMPEFQRNIRVLLTSGKGPANATKSNIYSANSFSPIRVGVSLFLPNRY